MAEYAEFRWRSKEGLDLYARDYAAEGRERGSPVVCLHGLTRNSRDFEAVAPWIAAHGRRVIVPDMRGRGRSAYDPDPARYVVPVYAADVLALSDALGVGRAVLIGTSMGGLITAATAVLRPEFVAGAALNDVGPELAPEGLARIMGYVGQTAPVRSWAAAAARVRETNGAAFPGYNDEDWLAFALRTFHRANGGVAPDYDAAIAIPFRSPPSGPPPEPWSVFCELMLGRPCLLIRGAISDLLTVEVARRMCEAAPEMTFAEVPRTGHAPMLSEPAAQAALEMFFAALAAKGL
jgi:pimeloyl-ACP methyl ester carboxylesterase